MTAGSFRSFQYKFYCLQVIEAQIQNQLHSGQVLVGIARQVLFAEMKCCSQAETPFFYRSKLATTLVKIFKFTYRTEWRSAVSEIVALLLNSSPSPTFDDFFLLICQAIDEEIVNLAIHRSDAEISHNSLIKDQLREGDIGILFQHWIQLLQKFVAQGDFSKLEFLLKVIGRFSSWIDVEFLKGEQFIAIIRQILSINAQVRAAAIDCLGLIFSKGMPPEGKLRLLEIYGIFELIPALFEFVFSTNQQQQQSTEQISFCKLLNSVGIETIFCWNEDQLVVGVLEKIGFLFSFLVQIYESHAILDLLVELTGFLTDFIDLLKGIAKKSNSPSHPTLNSLGKRILPAIVTNLKYPPEFDFEEEPGDLETWFLDFRNILSLSLINLYPILEEHQLCYIRNRVLRSLSTATSDADDFEVAIYLVYLYAEMTKCIPERVSRNDFPKDLDELLVALITSSPSQLFRPFDGKYLIFFETTVRYSQYGFFGKHVDLLVKCCEFNLSAFETCTTFYLKSKLSSLITRFIKLQKNLLIRDAKLCQFLISHLLPHLRIVPNNCGDCDDEFGGIIAPLYECIGNILLGCEDSFFLLQQIISLVYQQSTQYSNQPSFFVNSFIAIGSIAKGFPEFNESSPQLQSNYSLLVGFGEFSLKVLAQFPSDSSITGGIVFLMQRLFIAIGPFCIEFVPQLLSSILPNGALKDYSDLYSLFGSFPHKYPDKVGQIFSPIMNILLQKTFDLISYFKPEGTDDEIALATLKRCFLSFCYSLFASNIGSGLLSTRVLEVSTFHSFLTLIVGLGLDFNDRSIQKQSFQLMNKTIQTWMPNTTDNGGSQEGLSGFDRFVYSHYFNSCLSVVKDDRFDFTDGQSLLIFNEICSVFKNSFAKQPEMTGDCLREVFRSLSIPDPSIQMAIKLLGEVEVKQFKKFYLEMFQSLRKQ